MKVKLKTRLYSDESEAAVTMISGTCLVCDYQGVPHRVFCDVTAGRRQPGRPEIEHLRYRLEGVLAVTLSLGSGMPDGLCLKCEKGLCEIESRVRGFRDMHHATREKYRQMRVAGSAFICDLTRLETRHSEGGSETRSETETRPETETYLPQTSLPAIACQVWQGSDPRHGPRRDGEVCWEGEVTPQSVNGNPGVQSTGSTIRPGPMPAEHRHSIGGAQLTDNTMDTSRNASQPTHSTISSYTDSTMKGYGNPVDSRHWNSINREVDGRMEVKGNTHNITGYLNDGHVDDSNRPAEHCNVIGGQFNGRMENASRLLVNHKNSISSELKDTSGDTYCRRFDTQCSVNGVNLATERRKGGHQQLSVDETCVNGHSAEEPYIALGNDCYTDKLAKACPCPMHQEQNPEKLTENVGIESGLENRPTALNLSQTVAVESQDDTNGLALDLTVPRSVLGMERVEHQMQNIDNGISNAANEASMPIVASKPELSQKDYLNCQGGEWENSNHQEKQCVNGTPQSAWACSKAPPPLIHVSQIKEEPIETDPPSTKRHMSSLDYLQKMPFCIEPIEEGKGVGQGEFYDDGLLGEPPQKKYKYTRGYSVPNQDASNSNFPVLNTHVSATLNVTRPEKNADKNVASEKTPDANSALGETVQTTTIQGTICIPLNQLQNMKQGPANISLMTEATVNSSFAPSQQEGTNHDEQPQPSQHTAKIPVNMRVNTDELRARIPLHEAFLDHMQPAMPSRGVNQSSTPSRRVVNAFQTHGIPVHHLEPRNCPMNPGSVNVRQLRKGLQPPEWMRTERPIQGVQAGNPQSNTNNNLHLQKAGLEVTGQRGQGHIGQGQGQIASEKLGSTHQMASYSWQHPRFSRAVVGRSQGQPMFSVPLQHASMLPDKRVPQGHIPQGKPQQRQPHPSQPQGHSQSHLGQTESQLHEGQTQGQGQKERSLSQHQGQEQPHEGHSDKGSTRQGLASQGQDQGQIHDREPGHCISLPVGGHLVQNTSVQKTNQLDNTQATVESEEEEEEEEDDGKHVTDLDVNPGYHTSRNESSGRRQLLRPWLEARLNRGHIPGFQWVDKERNLFKIPWKHRSKNDWSPDNCAIFMEWALHTGKHRVGVDKPDYCRWKTRLRCAFNQAADIQERKDLNKMKCSEPYKVYEFLSKSEIKPKPPPKPKQQLSQSKMQVLATSTALPPGTPGTVSHSTATNHQLTGTGPQCVATVQSPKTMEMYTAVTGTLRSLGGALIHPDQGTPSSAPSSAPSSSAPDHQDTPPPVSSEQKYPNTTQMAAEPFRVEPVSIPVETNNNKFSWDVDLDDEQPLVIDLDRADNGNGTDNRDNVQEGQNKPSRAYTRQNGQTQGGQFSYLNKQPLSRSRDGLYTCDLCGQCFTLADALAEHRDKIHGVFSDKSETMCNGIVNSRSAPIEGNG